MLGPKVLGFVSVEELVKVHIRAIFKNRSPLQPVLCSEEKGSIADNILLVPKHSTEC